jgi:hypothetical protein
MFETAAGSIFAFEFNLFAAAAWWLQKCVVGLIVFAINMIIIAPDPNLTSAWFRGEYGIVLQISLFLLIPIIFAATIGALMRGGLQQVLRTYLWALPIGIFGGVVAIAIIEIAIKIDHELTIAVFSNSRETIQSFYDALNEEVKDDEYQEANNVGWAFTQMVCMFIMLFLILFLMLEMFFRQVMIYMGALFIPFALAAFIWGPIRVWFYNLCELIVTMVFAKFVIAAVMSFGFTAMAYGLTGAGEFDSAQLAVVFGALIIMVIACMSGPVLVTFIMAPSHSILSFKAAKQVTPWNHDRKFAGQLFKANYDSLKSAVKGGG